MNENNSIQDHSDHGQIYLYPIFQYCGYPGFNPYRNNQSKNIHRTSTFWRFSCMLFLGISYATEDIQVYDSNSCFLSRPLSISQVLFCYCSLSEANPVCRASPYPNRLSWKFYLLNFSYFFYEPIHRPIKLDYY